MQKRESKNKTLREILCQWDYFCARGIHTNGTMFSSLRINCYNALNAQSPFGGFKMSGNGREM